MYVLLENVTLSSCGVTRVEGNPNHAHIIIFAQGDKLSFGTNYDPNTWAKGPLLSITHVTFRYYTA